MFLSKIKSKHVKIIMFIMFVVLSPLSITYGKDFFGFNAFFGFAVVFALFAIIKIYSLILKRDENFYDTKFSEVKFD